MLFCGRMLIVFDGIDGSGKSTHIPLVAKYLRKKGKLVKILSYPDKKGVYSKILYGFLKEDVHLNPASQFLAFLADIAKDQEEIEKLLDKGYYVLVDRYVFSTIAYQKIPLDRACKIVEDLHFLKPSHVFLFDISPDIAIKRMEGKRRYMRFERDREHLTIARIRFRTIADQCFFTSKWKTIDTARDQEEVAKEIKVYLDGVLK